jgi:hypothetical protein
MSSNRGTAKAKNCGVQYADDYSRRSRMKGHVILPTFYLSRWVDDYKHLLQMVSDRLEFTFEYSDAPHIPVGTDTVILFATPHHMRPDVLMQMVNTPKEIRLIGFMKDIQHYGDQHVLDNYRRMFDRYDVILSPSHHLFVEMYPEYVSKMVYFPDFFGPHERYARLGYNETPAMRCLVSGTASKDVYPLRAFIVEHKEDLPIDYMPNPLSGHDFVGDKYAKLLYSYFCCATCSSVFHYTLAKYFEIPASGSLLIADSTDDLLSLGFTPGRHFVDLPEGSDPIGIIMDCIAHPERYEAIRERGCSFVRSNHGIYNRFEQLKKVLNGNQA